MKARHTTIRGINYMDWNGDGKHDAKDDAFFHNVINSDNNDNGGSGGKPPGNSGAGCSSWVIDLIALGYLSVLLPGDIDINGFTMVIGIICLGRLGYTFLKWLYS